MLSVLAANSATVVGLLAPCGLSALSYTCKRCAGVTLMPIFGARNAPFPSPLNASKLPLCAFKFQERTPDSSKPIR